MVYTVPRGAPSTPLGGVLPYIGQWVPHRGTRSAYIRTTRAHGCARECALGRAHSCAQGTLRGCPALCLYVIYRRSLYTAVQGWAPCCTTGLLLPLMTMDEHVAGTRYAPILTLNICCYHYEERPAQEHIVGLVRTVAQKQANSRSVMPPSRSVQHQYSSGEAGSRLVVRRCTS